MPTTVRRAHTPALCVRGVPGAGMLPALPLLLALLAVTLGATTGLLALATGPAYSHAGLVSSDPEEDSKLDAAPTEVTLTFNEEVREPAFVVITAPDGKQQELDKPTIAGEVVTQTLDPDTEAARHPGGAWTVAYRVVSADGHTVQGHVRFRVAGEAPSPTSTTAAPTPDAEATPTPRASGNGDADEDDSGSIALLLISGSLAILVVVVAIVQRRRSQE